MTPLARIHQLEEELAVSREQIRWLRAELGFADEKVLEGRLCAAFNLPPWAAEVLIALYRRGDRGLTRPGWALGRKSRKVDEVDPNGLKVAICQIRKRLGRASVPRVSWGEGHYVLAGEGREQLRPFFEGAPA